MSNLSSVFSAKDGVVFLWEKCYTSVTLHVQSLGLQTSVLPKFRGVFIPMLGCEKKSKV